MDFYGRFGHAELATDHLVGVALAETNENGVLPLGELGRMPRAIEAMVARQAHRLVVEKGALLLVKTVLRPERRRLRLLFRSRKRLLLGKFRLSVFDGRRAKGLAGQEGGRWKISPAVKDERKGLQRKVGRHGIAEIALGPATDRRENGGGIFIVGDDGERCVTAKRMQHLYLGEDLVGRGSADAVNQHVACRALHKSCVRFVGIERNQLDAFVAGPRVQEALCASSSEGHCVYKKNRFLKWDRHNAPLTLRPMTIDHYILYYR